MIIRLAQKKDITGIQVLMDRLNQFRQKHVSRKNKLFHARTKPHATLSAKDMKKYILLVAEERGQLCGFIAGSIHVRPSHSLSKLGYIDELFVEEASRRNGVAKKLAVALQKHFREVGCDHMITKTDEENISAQHFYAAIGMKRATVELWKKL